MATAFLFINFWNFFSKYSTVTLFVILSKFQCSGFVFGLLSMPLTRLLFWDGWLKLKCDGLFYGLPVKYFKYRERILLLSFKLFGTSPRGHILLALHTQYLIYFDTKSKNVWSGLSPSRHPKSRVLPRNSKEENLCLSKFLHSLPLTSAKLARDLLIVY